jgi:hypothetical protein
VHIPLAFFEKPTPFLDLHFIFSSSTYNSTTCLRTSAGRTILVFKNLIRGRTSQVEGFSIFVLTFNDYSQFEENRNIVLCNTPGSFPNGVIGIFH